MPNFHHWFFPHPANNHKPRLLHHSSLLAYIALFLFVQLVFSVTMVAKPEVLGLATNISVGDLLTETNAKRVENGLSPLRLNDQLSQAAAGKASDMFAKNYWAHYAPDGSTPWAFIEGAGYRYKYAGENLARDFSVSPQVVSAWMDSDAHRKNILDSRFQDVGFAVVNGTLEGSETTLVVQMFATPGVGQIAQAPKEEVKPPVVTQTPASQFTPTVEVTVPVRETITQAPIIEITQVPAVFPAVSPDLNQARLGATSEVIKKPLLNVASLTRSMSIGLALMLIALMYVDALHMFKKKIYRISGNNIAHMTFLLAIVIMLYLVKSGTII